MRLMTIGHSNKKLEVFLSELVNNKVTTLCDVRSFPISKWCPHFNKSALESSLKVEGINYLHIPNLGGRPKNPTLYEHGTLSYTKMVEGESFKEGIEKITSGGNDGGCLMCSERDPLSCHRFVIISRYLRKDVNLVHILPSHIETQHDTESRMVQMYQGSVNWFSLFGGSGKVDIERVYDLRHRDIYR